MVSINYDRLFATIEELVMHHSPSGVEQEIDGLLLERFRELGREVGQDTAGNIIVKLSGREPGAIAITGQRTRSRPS